MSSTGHDQPVLFADGVVAIEIIGGAARIDLARLGIDHAAADLTPSRLPVHRLIMTGEGLTSTHRTMAELIRRLGEAGLVERPVVDGQDTP